MVIFRSLLEKGLTQEIGGDGGSCWRALYVDEPVHCLFVCLSKNDGAVLFINLREKGLTPRACIGGGGFIPRPGN